MSITRTGIPAKGLCILFFMLYSQLLPAQQIKGDSLPEIQVKAITLPHTSSYLTTQRLGRGELLQTNSSTLAEALRHFSGVQVIDYGGLGGLKTVNIRSLGSSQTAVFYDGVRISDVQNGQIDLGKYSLEGLAGLSLGPENKDGLLVPASWYASAASLYLYSARPDFRDPARVHLRFGLTAGSFGLIKPAFSGSLRINRRMVLSLSEEYTASRGDYPFQLYNGVKDSFLRRQNAGIDAFKTEANLYTDLADSSRLDLKFYQYHSSRGLPAAAIINNISSRQHLNDRDYFIQGSWKTATQKKLALLVSGKFSSNFTHYTDPDYLNNSGGLDNIYVQKEYFISGAGRYTLSRNLELALATDVSGNTMAANLVGFPFPKRLSILESAGLRLSCGAVEIKAFVLGEFSQEKVTAGKAQASHRGLNPFLVFTWKSSNRGPTVEASYKESFRLPTFNELYYTQSGNPGLKPEYARIFNLSLNQRLLGGTGTRLDLKLSGFINQVTDKIITIPTGNLFIWSNLNLGIVKIEGLEGSLNMEQNLGRVQVLAAASATLESSRDLTRGSFTYGQQIPYSARISASATAGISYRGWGLNDNLVFTGSRYSLRENSGENHLPPWLLQDASVYRQWKTGTSLHAACFRIQAEINNIGNTSYEVIRSFPMPGRSYRIRLTFNI